MEEAYPIKESGCPDSDCMRVVIVVVGGGGGGGVGFFGF